MDDIKYLGVQGLEELIILTQNALAKKADVLQFEAMPDPTKYIGKIVQYVGISDISFTRGHFYYSNGIKWAEEIVSGEQPPKIKMVTALPSWVDSDPQVLYILKNTADITMNFYVKNPSVNDVWFTVEKSVSFAVVDSLPQWADADSSIIYFKADGNALVGYIKNTSTTNAWYALGEKPQITIDTAISATSTNPLQNKVIFTEIKDLRDDIAANSNALGSLGTEVQGLHDDITASQDADKELRDAIDANSNALGSLGIEVQGLHDAIDACQDTDKQLRKDIGANSTAISRIDGEISRIDGKIRDLHGDITACQDAHEQFREDIHIDSVAIARIDGELHTLATTVREHSTEIERIDGEIRDIHDVIDRIDNDVASLRTDVRTHTAVISRLQNQDILSDFEDITISGITVAPTRMQYDGYVTVIENGVDSGVQLYINGKEVARASRHHAVTVFVAKNDDLYLLNPSNGRVAYARFYKLRDYTNRPPKA